MNDLNELAMLLAKEACERLIRLPDVDAVCVTLVSKNENAPLGLSMTHPEQSNVATTLRAISKLNEHANVLIQALSETEEKTNGGTIDGKDGEGVGESRKAEPQPQSDRVADLDEGDGVDEEP